MPEPDNLKFQTTCCPIAASACSAALAAAAAFVERSSRRSATPAVRTSTIFNAEMAAPMSARLSWADAPCRHIRI
jgi:hypothetical protein